jgi:hypothetical protein
MPTKVKAETRFAKEEAKLATEHRRVFSRNGMNYDKDRARYGAPVADYNAGFLSGWDDGYDKGYRDGKAGVPRHGGSRRSKGR